MSRTDEPIVLDRYEAAVFDLDGVVTDTASAHMAAWKETFDELLRRRDGDEFEPFSSRDYRQWVDGKPRFDGIRSFLEHRDIDLPEGDPDDPPGFDSVMALGKHKNRRYHRHLEGGAVEVFDDTVEVIHRLGEAGLGLAVVSSSRNAGRLLESTGLTELFEVRIDGVTLAEEQLPGKPAPAMFVEATRRVGADPEHSIAVEDAESGVAAGRAGRFGLVIGLAADAADRRRLLEAGADRAVASLAELEFVEA